MCDTSGVAFSSGFVGLWPKFLIDVWRMKLTLRLRSIDVRASLAALSRTARLRGCMPTSVVNSRFKLQVKMFTLDTLSVVCECKSRAGAVSTCVQRRAFSSLQLQSTSSSQELDCCMNDLGMRLCPFKQATIAAQPVLEN